MVRRCWSFRARKKLAVVIERICSAGRACRKATRLKALEGKRAKLKNLLTEQMLGLAARKVLVSKSGRARREALDGTTLFWNADRDLWE